MTYSNKDNLRHLEKIYSERSPNAFSLFCNRRYLGLTQSDLARGLEVSSQTVSYWENDKRNVPHVYLNVLDSILYLAGSNVPLQKEEKAAFRKGGLKGLLEHWELGELTE